MVCLPPWGCACGLAAVGSPGLWLFKIRQHHRSQVPHTRPSPTAPPTRPQAFRCHSQVLSEQPGSLLLPPGGSGHVGRLVSAQQSRNGKGPAPVSLESSRADGVTLGTVASADQEMRLCSQPAAALRHGWVAGDTSGRCLTFPNSH